MRQTEQIAVFERTIREQMPAHGIQLSVEIQKQLGRYYELLLRWNKRLHLVAPCSAEEFAVRHVLESLSLLAHLPEGATVADVGSGAGLPIIPCLIARPDISAALIESSQKKSVFLREALKTVNALNRANIISKPFEQIPPTTAQFVTCRALDEFSGKLSLLIRWAADGSRLLLFGGDNLRQQLTIINIAFNEYLLLNSRQRYLFLIEKP